MNFWIIQTLGIITIALTILSFYQKEKWKMMVCFALTNALLMTTYFLCGSLLGGLLVAGALVRSLVYFYYNRKNKKPESIIMILFQIYYLVVSILLYKNFIDIIILVNLILVTYTSWQDNVKVLRFGYIFSAVFLCTYDILLGAYTTAISEILMLLSVCISLIKYAKVTKSSIDVAQRYFTANKNFWGSRVEEFEDFDMIISNTVDSSPFYNFGILKNHDKINETILAIKEQCKANKIKEVAYFPFDAKVYNRLVSDAHMLEMFFPIVFNDVWMKLIDGFNLNNTKCKIQGVTFKEVDESNINQIIEVYLKGYHAKTDVNDLNDNEKLQVENLKKVDFLNMMDGYEISAYLAYYNNAPISLVVMLSNKVESFITKVSTLPVFRRKHVASSLMQYGINKQRTKGVQEIILVTDKYSSNEKFYAFNSFVEFGQAFALDVTDTTKYNDYIENNKI